jgi:hypothetical protein
MRLVWSLFLAAALASVSAAKAAPEESKPGKEELVRLYLLSVAADRCGFPLTNKQADRIDQEAQALVEKLKLKPRENDALYSEADVAFEKQGSKACDRNGAFAKGFRQTLQKLTGQ